MENILNSIIKKICDYKFINNLSNKSVSDKNVSDKNVSDKNVSDKCLAKKN